MILYLDFDGVLHPSEVHLVDNKPVLHWPLDRSLALFCWVPILESILDDEDPAGRIKIVISSTWGHRFGWEAAAGHLPAGLQYRVVGGTIGALVPRWLQIKAYALEARHEHWLAIDDDGWNWPPELRKKLVHAHYAEGLSNLETQQELREKLAQMLRKD